MPLLTTVIDDKSPVIKYDSTWLFGTSWDDPLASYYYLSTFTTNNVTDGSVSFNFNGTAIWIYGANRPNHGSYVVQLDSQTYSGYNGAGNNLFQQILFNVSALGQGMHNLKLTNTATGSLFVGIDMIVWQSEVGNTGDQLVSEVVQDTDPRFSYQEPAWTTTSSSLDFNLFNNGSGHVTGTYDAAVTFTFTGVTLYGTSGPFNGQYSVQLDAGQAVIYNATNSYPTNYGVSIYHADNLGPGSHQIVLTNLPAGNGQVLSIDYAQLWTLEANGTGTTDSCTSASSSRNNISSGAIAGIVVAVVVAVVAAGAAMFFHRRWKAALSAQDSFSRHFIAQQRFSELPTVVTTGFSSSLDTRKNESFSGRAHHEAIPLSSGSRDSRSVIGTANSSAGSLADGGLGRRPLPGAPGGGLPLSAEFPKLSGLRRGQSIDHSSVAMSDVPPDYSQAIGDEATSRVL